MQQGPEKDAMICKSEGTEDTGGEVVARPKLAWAAGTARWCGVGHGKCRRSQVGMRAVRLGCGKFCARRRCGKGTAMHGMRAGICGSIINKKSLQDDAKADAVRGRVINLSQSSDRPPARPWRVKVEMDLGVAGLQQGADSGLVVGMDREIGGLAIRLDEEMLEELNEDGLLHRGVRENRQRRVAILEYTCNMVAKRTVPIVPCISCESYWEASCDKCPILIIMVPRSTLCRDTRRCAKTQERQSGRGNFAPWGVDQGDEIKSGVEVVSIGPTWKGPVAFGVQKEQVDQIIIVIHCCRLKELMIPMDEEQTLHQGDKEVQEIFMGCKATRRGCLGVVRHISFCDASGCGDNADADARTMQEGCQGNVNKMQMLERCRCDADAGTMQMPETMQMRCDADAGTMQMRCGWVATLRSSS
ncbi:hypothetical protein FB451DRAFT_1174990 [Mycena latifolia]|nr:hypothetical protein FB451DRAFT_1174990 [Mycena latifolia]